MTNSNPDLDELTDVGFCAHANLRRAMRVTSQFYDAALKPTGLRATQFTLLAVVERRGEMPLSKLADVLVMDRTTLTRNLQPLIKNRWLSIGREADERVKLVSISPAGKAIVAEAMPFWRQAQDQVIAGLGGERMPGMIKDLRALVDVVGGS
ncbi:MAG: winged helix-turn-helix transcriptional regulator [Alphaproteobacteria bacterium]|nr:winged helix-turn-helix transcriptional regulator [Alphaproteobacteria bacterium]